MRRNRGYVEQAALEEEATLLKAGLLALGPDYCAEVCGLCNGHGEYLQRYVEGRMRGDCDWCEGQGLVYPGYRVVAVGDSVLSQVALAGGATATQVECLVGHQPNPKGRRY